MRCVCEHDDARHRGEPYPLTSGSDLYVRVLGTCEDCMCPRFAPSRRARNEHRPDDPRCNCNSCCRGSAAAWRGEMDRVFAGEQTLAQANARFDAPHFDRTGLSAGEATDG